MKTTIKCLNLLILIILSIGLSSCASNYYWASVHPSWNPPQGGEYAVAQCKAKSEMVYAPNPFDEAFKRKEIYNKCMEAFGYALQKPPKDVISPEGHARIKATQEKFRKEKLETFNFKNNSSTVK